MFHILSLEGATYNVPLESLREREELKRIERGAPTRKVVGGGEAKGGEAGQRTLTYAEKAYRAAIQFIDEREPLLHAFEIMSHPVITIAPGMNVADGWRFFQEKGVRHMPVLSNGAIVGVVSEHDLLKHLIIRDKAVAYETSMCIADMMSHPVISASPQTDIRRIARAMFENHVGTMPILGDQKLLAGIITRSDILFALIHYGPLKLWA